MKKRILALLCALSLAPCLLAGCAGGGDSITSQTGGNGGGSNAPREDVVIAISSEPETLDPCKGWGHGTTPLVQSTLVEYKQDMTIVNDLATDYVLSDDGLTWTFTIRDDVFFTDGEKLTAEDVAFTFMTAKESQT